MAPMVMIIREDVWQNVGRILYIMLINQLKDALKIVYTLILGRLISSNVSHRATGENTKIWQLTVVKSVI